MFNQKPERHTHRNKIKEARYAFESKKDGIGFSLLLSPAFVGLPFPLLVLFNWRLGSIVLFLYTCVPSLWLVKNDWRRFTFRAIRKAHLFILYLISSIALRMCFKLRLIGLIFSSKIMKDFLNTILKILSPHISFLNQRRVHSKNY